MKLGVCTVLTACSLVPCALLVQGLYLETNQIGDLGLASLADVCGPGVPSPFSQLQHLRLGNNDIGDVGVTALTKACAKGGLKCLKELSLVKNQISDVGLASLKTSISVRDLYLGGNPRAP